jgi:hypothetical protein
MSFDDAKKISFNDEKEISLKEISFFNDEKETFEKEISFSMSFEDAKEISFNDEKEISLKEISFSVFFEDAKEISFNDEKETTSVDLVPDVVSATRTRPQSGTPGPGSLSQWFTSASVRRSSSVRSRVDLLPLLRRDLELLLGPGPLGMGRERLIPADLLGVLRLERLRTSGRSNERALKSEASTNVERSPEFLASSPSPHPTSNIFGSFPTGLSQLALPRRRRPARAPPGAPRQPLLRVRWPLLAGTRCSLPGLAESV